MRKLRMYARISIVLGSFSFLGILVSHLALTDIWHGDEDVNLEWNVLRIAFLVIIIFHVSALATLVQFLRGTEHA